MYQQQANLHIASFADLPPHLIEKILSYCFLDRHELKTVCKAFYETFWKLYGANLWLNLETDRENRISKDSINRFFSGHHPARISSVHIKSPKNTRNFLEESTENLFNFIEANGHLVKNLKLTKYPELNLDMLNRLFSNIKNLAKLSWSYYDYEEGNLNLRGLVNLSDIEIISFTFHEDSMRAFFESVRDSLRNLEMVAEIFVLTSDAPIFKDFKIERFILKTCRCYISDSLPRFLMHQKHLKYLKVEDSNITDESLEIITSTSLELEELSIELYLERPDSFDKLARLKKLKHLELVETTLDDIIFTKKELPIPSLSLFFCQIESVETARCVARKFSKLKILRLEGCLDDEEIYQEFVPRFKNLDELFIDIEDGIYEFKPIKGRNQVLKKMSIQNVIDLDLYFLRCFPNLMELNIQMKDQVEFLKAQVEGIFQKFPKLKKFKLDFELKGYYKLDFDILALLNKNISLEIFELTGINHISTAIKRKKPKRFEICEIEVEEVLFQRVKRSYSILFATDAEVLTPKENYRKALKYGST